MSGIDAGQLSTTYAEDVDRLGPQVVVVAKTKPENLPNVAGKARLERIMETARFSRPGPARCLP